MHCVSMAPPYIFAADDIPTVDGALPQLQDTSRVADQPTRENVKVYSSATQTTPSCLTLCVVSPFVGSRSKMKTPPRPAKVSATVRL